MSMSADERMHAKLNAAKDAAIAAGLAPGAEVHLLNDNGTINDRFLVNAEPITWLLESIHHAGNSVIVDLRFGNVLMPGVLISNIRLVEQP